MFKTIIVGVDGREGGRDALALAASLQRVFASDLVAVHAFPVDYYVGRGANGAYDEALHERAAKTVRDEVERSAVTAQAVTVADDSPGRALHRAASGHDADLIVVGSAHHGRVGRVLAGDVTAGTLHGAPCPVLVAPRGQLEDGRRPADHRRRLADALRQARARGRRGGSGGERARAGGRPS